MHSTPDLIGCRTPLQDCGGTGGFQRRSPTGGFAYGIPRNRRILPSATRSPRTKPLSTRTVPSLPGDASASNEVKEARAVAPATKPFLMLMVRDNFYPLSNALAGSVPARSIARYPAHWQCILPATAGRTKRLLHLDTIPEFLDCRNPEVSANCYCSRIAENCIPSILSRWVAGGAASVSLLSMTSKLGSARRERLLLLTETVAMSGAAAKQGLEQLGTCSDVGLQQRSIMEPVVSDVMALPVPNGAPFTVYLTQQILVDAAGRRHAFDIDPMRREALLAGLDDVGLTLLDDATITAWQSTDRSHRPWHGTQSSAKTLSLMETNDEHKPSAPSPDAERWGIDRGARWL